MRLLRRYGAAVSAALSVAILLAGCVLAPRDTKREQERLEAAGRSFEPPVGERTLPGLTAEPDWPELLRHALLASGELENAYFEWKAAMERINIAAGYPNTNVSVGFEYMFSGGNIKAWDRSTLSVGFDPMQNLSFPSKIVAAGRVALADAQVAGERFRAVKFDLQRRVLSAYWEYALIAEKQRLQRDNLDLLALLAETATARVRAGGTQPELLAAQVAVDRAANDLRSYDAELVAQRAMLNALVGREADAPLEPAVAFPHGRDIRFDDSQLEALAVDNNPELAAMAHAADSRRLAVEAARQRYWPDINPFVGLTGSLSQVAGAAITLSTMLPQIRAAIDESRAMQRGAEAMLRQSTLDRRASVVSTLAALRDSERQARVFEEAVLPALTVATGTYRESYSTGRASLQDLVDNQRMQLDVRQRIAELRAAREQRLADLEALVGVDLETLDAHIDTAKPSPVPLLGKEGEPTASAASPLGKGGPQGGELAEAAHE